MHHVTPEPAVATTVAVDLARGDRLTTPRLAHESLAALAGRNKLLGLGRRREIGGLERLMGYGLFIRHASWPS